MVDSTSWHSYPKVYAIGHAAMKDLLLDDVIVEEKIDGSQFSFGMIDVGDGQGLRLRCRSKGAELHLDAPEAMFIKAVQTAKKLAPTLTPGWTYRCEYLAKPKHNTLAYERTPQDYLIVFDVNTGHEQYMALHDKQREADRIGLECVQAWTIVGGVKEAQQLRNLLSFMSALGSQKIEGVVVKNYARFGPDGKALMGKYVSEAFKEVHGNDWKERNPKSGDIIQRLIDKYRTPARWAKAVQHLKEAGKLEQSPKDIGALIAEAQRDLIAECEEEIKAELWQWAVGNVTRGATGGIATWYKDELLKMQFDKQVLP